MPFRLEYELLQAISNDNLDYVESLLASGADPNAGLYSDESALSLAVRNGNEKVVELLLQRGSICCMNEEHQSNQERRFSKTLALQRNLRRVIVGQTVICLATYTVRRMASLLPVGVCRTTGIYGSYFIPYICLTSIESYHSTTSIRRRFLASPTIYIESLMNMGISYYIPGWFLRNLLPPALPKMSLPTFFDSLLVALPLRFCVDTIVVDGRNLGERAGLIKIEQKRWTGDYSPFPSTLERWVSPAEKVFAAITDSESITEEIVLKLLRAGTLISQPCKQSEVARKLFQLAIERCWSSVATFLIENGVPVDRGASPSSRTMKWPAIYSAFIYTFPTERLDTLLSAWYDSRAVLSFEDDFEIKHNNPVSTFINLVTSDTFQKLASSAAQADWDHCQKMIRILKDGKADPLLTKRPGFDALYYLATENCSTEVLRYMANVWKEARSSKISTQGSCENISLALYRVATRCNPVLEALRILLDAGLDQEWEDENGRTLLYMAAYMNNGTSALQCLFEHGVNLNNGGSKGRPPILRTLDDTSEEKFVLFLDHGANPNAKDNDGHTILQLVLQEASPEAFNAFLVQALLDRGALAYDVASNSSPAFLTAVFKFNSDGCDKWTLNRLLAQIPYSQLQNQLDSALQIASGQFWVNLFTVFYLLQQGADLHLAQVGSDSLLHQICASYGTRDHEHKFDMKSLLRLEVLDVNALGTWGWTPLHHAVIRGSRDFVLLLLEHNADPNIRTDDGQTALQQLCATTPLEYSIADSFEELDYDNDASQYDGVRGKAAWKFTSRGRRLAIKGSLEKEETFQALILYGADIEQVDSEGRTLLMRACENGNCVLAANILYYFGEERQHEALVATDLAGRTALHHASANGNSKIIKVLLNPKQLLRHAPNYWRVLAVYAEQHPIQEKSTREKAEDQCTSYADSMALPSCLRKSCINFNEPVEEVRLTIGNSRRSEDANMCLPNISVATWALEKQENRLLQSMWSVDMLSRTPLHYAAQKGHLESVRLLLEFTSVRVNQVDYSSKRAADLALEGDFYDVYSLLEEAD